MTSIAGDASPSWIKQYGFHQWHYFSGDAHDPSVQEVIKSQFHGLLTSLVPPFFCPHPTCNKDDFTVSPGVTGSYYTRLNCVFFRELLISHPPLFLTFFAKKIRNERGAVIWSLHESENIMLTSCKHVIYFISKVSIGKKPAFYFQRT